MAKDVSGSPPKQPELLVVPPTFLPAPPGTSPELVKRLEGLVQKFAIEALDNNRKNLRKSNAYMNVSFKTLYVMYALMFIVGLAAGIVVVIKLLNDTTETVGIATSGAVFISSVLSLFLTRPFESLERSSIYTSWLMLVTNTYWMRWVYIVDPKTVDTDLKHVTDDLVRHLRLLAENHTAAIAKYQPPASSDAAKADSQQERSNDQKGSSIKSASQFVDMLKKKAPPTVKID